MVLVIVIVVVACPVSSLSLLGGAVDGELELALRFRSLSLAFALRILLRSIGNERRVPGRFDSRLINNSFEGSSAF